MVKLNKEEFNEHIFERINNLISDYELIKEGELIAVALSGGKDSVLTLHALKNYQKFLFISNYHGSYNAGFLRCVYRTSKYR